jgi:threonine dehydrogenase-like Zn-dependent dehydrogenase
VKALVVVPGGRTEVVDRPDPQPEPGRVVVKVHSCGICGSDVHAVEGGVTRHGVTLGHEFSGTIADAGPGVDGWAVGRSVAVNPLGGCGSCAACRQDLPFLCQAVPNLGLTAPGGFAEYVSVPAGQLFALPERVDTELGAHAEPLAVATHALGLAQPAPDSNALVFGVGPIGLSVIIALRAAGAGTVVAVGRSPGRRAAAVALGADVVLDSRDTDVAEFAAEAGLTFSAVFECSGAPEAVALCAPALAAHGTVVQLAFSTSPVQVDTRLFVGRNLHFVGSCAFGVEEYRRALALVSSGKVDFEPLVSERVGLVAAPDAFQRLRHPNRLVGVLVQPWR